MLGKVPIRLAFLNVEGLVTKTVLNLNLNLNSLLVKRQIDNPSPGAVTGGNQSLALTREVNLDTLLSDSSEEEIRDSGRSFQSLIVWGKKLYI